MNRIPSLDGFRAVSIFLIIFCHHRYLPGFPNELVQLANLAAIGVTVFFVISGFLITTILLKEEEVTGGINVGFFYIRRAFRILPVIFLYLIVLQSQLITHVKISSSQVVHVLTFTENFNTRTNWFTGHFWSLAVEEQFYLFFPLLMVTIKRQRKTAVCVLIAYSCITRVIAYLWRDSIFAFPYAFFADSDAIMIGVLGAMILYQYPAAFEHRAFKMHSLRFVSLAAIGVIEWCKLNGHLGRITIPFANTIDSLAILFLLFSGFRPAHSYFFKFLNSKIMVHFGVLSYSMYIWQQIFFSGDPAIWRTFPINLVLIYIAALISYNVWEKPFIKLGKKYSVVKIPAPKTADLEIL